MNEQNEQNEQLALFSPPSPPLTCQLGWYYSPYREFTKTGEPIRKKPSYRLSTQYPAFTLGQAIYSTENSPTLSLIDNVLQNNRKPPFVLFFPPNQWEEISSSMINVNQNDNVSFNNLSINNISTLTTGLDITEDTVSNDKPQSLLQRFWNWVKGLE